MRVLCHFVIACAAGSLVWGCGKGGFSEREAVGKENTFRYPIVTNPTSLDPGVVQDGDTLDMMQQVYEGLVTWGTDNRVHPLLAESWDIEDGGRTYVFKLKQGVKFHSGREVTADDFKWTIERTCDPALGSPTAETYLQEIVGVMDKLRGKTHEIPGVQVRDKYTLAITIDKPRPYFLGKLTYLAMAVVDKDKAPAKEEIRSVEQMVGTGPFRAVQYVPDQIVVLEANKDYHGGVPLIERIERPVLKDPATRLNKYRGGELDLVMLERQDVEGLKKDPELSSHLKYFDRPAIWYIAMNHLVYPQFKDRRVRRAFAMAIDRKTIVDSYLGGINQEANTVVPPGVLGYRPEAKALPYDPDQARKLLAEAGYPNGRGFPELEMNFREARPDIRLVAEAAASQLQKNLGITVKLRTMEWRAYLEKHERSELGFFHMRWAADYLDPENFLSFLLAGYGPQNKVGYQNPEYDALCAQADTEMDTDKRMRLYAQAEEIVVNDAPFIPIYFQRDVELIHPRVSGLRESLFGHLPHTTVQLGPRK
ncbi:MAG: peptide ABC transporter substrate-binding protein [Fimbriimonadaceae bacterium]|nr:Heme-binding protein A [Fimbriimonadaceae bacterium]MCL4284789.1 peptide ABC transporter substrate-binding protein [Fimbriimonadaceae bacterium]